MALLEHPSDVLHRGVWARTQNRLHPDPLPLPNQWLRTLARRVGRWRAFSARTPRPAPHRRRAQIQLGGNLLLRQVTPCVESDDALAEIERVRTAHDCSWMNS